MLRFVKKIWYNKRIRICVIFMLVLLCLLIVFSWGLYRKLHRNRLYPVEQLSTPEQQLSAITLYYDFLGGMTSGKIIKTSCSFESLYDFVSSTTETITFTQTEDDKRILTYQQRQPIVFWYYPEPNYYDGTFYYYKHNGDWFIDIFNRHQNQIQQDTLGIPASTTAQYNIMQSQVYLRPDGDYQAYLYATNRKDPNRYVQIQAILDENFMFSYLEASVYSREKERRLVEKYTIEYQQVNEMVTVSPPDSLSQQEMEFLKEEYLSDPLLGAMS